MAAKKKRGFALLSDEPVLETTREDGLNFDPAARVLAGAALETKSPITLGVFGNWGTGKTSLMRLMWEIVRQEGVGEKPAIPVWFNAWQYEREEHLIIPLLATIVRDIKNREKNWNKIALGDDVGDAAKKALVIMKDGGKKVHNALRAVLYGLSMKGEFGVPGSPKIEISASMEDMIKRYEEITQDTLMARSLYFDAFDQLRALAGDEKVKKPQIVVFVDDLDRCFPEQAVRLLESIKLILHQPNFAFVLGIYPQIIEGFIRNKYANQYALSAARAATDGDAELRSHLNNYLKYFDKYLDKIVQVRHHVPKRSSEEMRGYIGRLLTDANVADEFTDQDIALEDLYDLIAEVGEHNPRDIVRKINGLIVKWRIKNIEKGDGEEFDLLAGLINEAIQDRPNRDEERYQPFLHRIAWSTGGEGDETYGAVLAAMLEAAQSANDHVERINQLKDTQASKDSATLRGLIDVLQPDESLCNVLRTQAGQRWLSDKKYREETRQTYEETEEAEEAPETGKDATPEPAAPRDTEFKKGISPREVATSKRVIYDEHTVGKAQDREGGIRELVDNMVSVPAGEFQMGSEDGEDREKPVRQVMVGNFEMGATPVTQAQYEAVMEANPSEFNGPTRPVEKVSWNDAMVFCERLTKLVKGKAAFTLPSEAQWEYACRAGSPGKWCFGDNEKELGDYAWYKDNAEGGTHPVGQRKPNKFGLYDVHGNVWEWCRDDWHGNYDGAPSNASLWGDGSGSSRVLRGGSWRYSGNCRSADRHPLASSLTENHVGFRVSRTP